MDIRNKPNSHVHPLLFLSLENVYSLSHSVTGWAHNANQSAPVRFHVRERTVWLALERGTTFLLLTFCKLIPPFSTLCNVAKFFRYRKLLLALLTLEELVDRPIKLRRLVSFASRSFPTNECLE